MRKSILSPIERLLVARTLVPRPPGGHPTCPRTPCWQSTYKPNTDGYTVIGDGRGSVLYGHRLAFEHWVGPIPVGRQIDHLCCNRTCWNPTHLEAVTQAVNVARGTSPGALASKEDLCRRGHSLDDAYRDRKGHRACRTCVNERQLRRYHDRKARGLGR